MCSTESRKVICGSFIVLLFDINVFIVLCNKSALLMGHCVRLLAKFKKLRHEEENRLILRNTRGQPEYGHCSG